jgi:hypothetical protein
MMEQAALQQILREFGSSIFAYVCNVPEPHVEALIRGSYELDESQSQVFQRLGQTLSQIRLQAALQGMPSYLLLSSLGQDASTYGRHPFNAWREEAGGRVPKLSSEDRVLETLAELAMDVYPTLLLLPHAPAGEHPMMLMHS